MVDKPAVSTRHPQSRRMTITLLGAGSEGASGPVAAGVLVIVIAKVTVTGFTTDLAAQAPRTSEAVGPGARPEVDSVAAGET